MVADQSKLLSTKCLKLCTSAKDILNDLCDRIISGDIYLTELSKVKGKSTHMKKLISSLSHKDEVMILQLLESRFKEEKLFLERLKDLGQLCLNITIPVRGEYI